MNVPALLLGLASTLLLAAASLLHPGGLFPAWLPLGLVAAGALPALYGAARGHTRTHAAGTISQIAGVSLGGPFAPPLAVLAGTLGIVLGIGSWTIGQTTPGRENRGSLTLLAAGTALTVSLAGWGGANALASLAAGAVDASVALAAWITLAAAATWLIARWAGRGS